jgi:type I restriction enzyme S subunit
VKDGDILFSRANTAELVGATAEVVQPPQNLLLPDKLWRIDVPGGAPCSTRFLFRFLQQQAVRRELSKLATGTSDSMRNISQGRLRMLEVICPPRSLQDEFEAKVREATAISLLAERAFISARATGSSLMARLFEA